MWTSLNKIYENGGNKYIQESLGKDYIRKLLSPEILLCPLKSKNKMKLFFIYFIEVSEFSFTSVRSRLTSGFATHSPFPPAIFLRT
jgi:hypothetical protein